ncbi:hypothetical protein MKW92_009782 [Papaver armeniacum]|nr:hypothetical protein MKW92_009782 [Papaver armeniacum]
MSCSGKSSSNWLDRLRVSKGFPAGNDIDLVRFLNPNTNGETNSVTETNDNKSVDMEEDDEEEEIQVAKVKKKQSLTYSRDEKDKENENLFDLMSGVLSELFIMDNNNNNSGRKCQGISSRKTKSGRKQKNPKPCVISNESDDPETSPSTADDNSDKEGDKKKLGFDLEKNKKWKGGYISGYSRADVMIIDTSVSIWKSDKWVFRKGNVWKVRDKKSRCRKVIRMRKKRKSNNQLSDSENVDKKKKKKERLLRISQSPSSSETDNAIK